MSTPVSDRATTDPIGAVLHRHVAGRELSGAATLVWSRGRVVQQACAGMRDLASGEPVTRDTVFRIASMTKPVTAVAALQMLEEGRFALDTPIHAVAPEFAAARVLRDVDGPLDDTVDAARDITFDDLLTHRAGLTYGDFHRGPIGAAYAEALGAQIDNDASPDEWIAGLATLPLVDQPGAGFHYGVSSDLLGFLLARIDATSLGDVLRRRVFEPLGMRDTGFGVAASARSRRAGFCGFDDAGVPAALVRPPGGHARAERPETMTFESGGQGLWSTVDDYLTFARLFVEGGEVDGTRVLRSDTLALMTSNHLTPSQRAAARLLGQPLFATGHGYGMGVAVVLEPEQASPLRCCGAAGTVGWPGAYGGWWQADPARQAVFVFLTHHMVELRQMAQGIGLGAWSAIADFHGAASAACR